MIVINDWFCTHSKVEPWTAPEQIKPVIAGNAAHPLHKGKVGPITTSAIVKAEGKIVTTKSGSKYELGTVEEGYKLYLAENYPNWDPNNPITMKE